MQQKEMKFLCDVMLARLGRWLRAAGYNTDIAIGNALDEEIYAKGIKEERLVLTRDKRFLDFPEAEKHVIWLKFNSLEECAQELTQLCNIDWTHHLFSRCLICNQEVFPAKEDQLQAVPADVRQQSSRFWYCTSCKKVYWEGSHTKRMRNKLHSWKIGEFKPNLRQ